MLSLFISRRYRRVTQSSTTQSLKTLLAQDDFATAVQGHHLIVSHPVSLSRFVKHHAKWLRARAGDEWEPI